MTIPASGSTNGQRKWDVLRTVWPELVDNLPETWAVGMMEWACPTCPAHGLRACQLGTDRSARHRADATR